MSSFDLATTKIRIIDSHLHVWATPQQAAAEYPFFPGLEPTFQAAAEYPFFPGLEPTLQAAAEYPFFRGLEPTLPGDVDFLLECMGRAGVDGALIVQPIHHMFDHSLVTSVLKKHPSKFVGCLLANPAEDGTGIKQLEHLVLEDGYRAVSFNPYLWPSGQKMTNEVGRAIFSRAGALGVPVGFMCVKGLNLHLSEIIELCSEFPSTTVILDHVAFCKPPENDLESETFSSFLKLSRFPQVYVKFSALFRVSRQPFPHDDTSHLLSQVISSYGANRVMWGSDFPYVLPECCYSYPSTIASVLHVACLAFLSPSDWEWLMGKTVQQLFPNSWPDRRFYEVCKEWCVTV